MAYSIFIDKQKSETDTLQHPLPRRVYKWIDDNTVSNCYNCNVLFTMFVRKHHCRFCGKIFCYQCLNYSTNIPDDLMSDDTKKGSWNEYITTYVYTATNDTTKHKVCKACKHLIEYINSVKKLIEVFVMVKFDIRDLQKASTVCKTWHYAANYILSIFREIQYKLSIDTPSKLEKSLLFNNLHYVGAHSKYITNLIKSFTLNAEFDQIIHILENEKTLDCWTMMCTRNCKQKLNSYDVINILSYFFRNNIINAKIIQSILPCLKCDDDEFKFYLPLLVNYLRYDIENIISSYIINRCKLNFDLLYLLYWELKMYPRNNYYRTIYTPILNQMKELLTLESEKTNYEKIKESAVFVNLLNSISNKICDQDKKYDDIKDDFYMKSSLCCPLDHKQKIKSIHIEKIKIKNSASKPLSIPCELESGAFVNILYKKENVRKDQIIMNLIHLANKIIKTEENIDIDVVSYNILPISDTSGLIEIIDNSLTVYHIQQKLGLSILNYILENNDDAIIGTVRTNFIKSTALYCVVSYLFGIGDRHLDNIMITRDGRLFHIDFGYILGNDPVVSNPGIRITADMIDAIGGFSSKYYEEFVELCTRIYNCLRRNINIFMDILLLLPSMSDINMTQGQISDFLISRFIPGENTIDAKIHITNQIDRQSYIDGIKDWCHYHSKEQTISSTINRLSKAVSSLVTGSTVVSNGHGHSIVDNSITD